MEQEQKFSFGLPKSEAVNIYLNFAEDGHSLLFMFEDPESGEKKEINISPINNGWISVDDRLPENDDDVLCWYEDLGWHDSKHKDKHIFRMGIGHCWKGEWAGQSIGSMVAKVLYWQSLPKPPKED